MQRRRYGFPLGQAEQMGRSERLTSKSTSHILSATLSDSSRPGPSHGLSCLVMRTMPFNRLGALDDIFLKHEQPAARIQDLDQRAFPLKPVDQHQRAFRHLKALLLLLAAAVDGERRLQEAI